MSLVTSVITRLRGLTYDRGWRRVYRAPVPVISIGNLTTGGTGKTPTVLMLARRLIDRGVKPAILLRGYGGTPVRHRVEPGTPPPPRITGSDEAGEYAEELGNAAVIAADPDRVRSSTWIQHAHPDVGVLLLDDGFQHRRMDRDVDLVLIDAMDPWGGGYLLPGGLLREPMSALRRADGVIVTRVDEVTPEALASLDRMIERYHGRPPLAHVCHRWTGFRDQRGQRHDVSVLKDRRVLLVSAIGHPEALAATARRHVGDLADVITRRDHAPYDAVFSQRMINRARALGVSDVLTTGKDWVKWASTWPHDDPRDIRVWRPVLSMIPLDGDADMDRVLLRLIRHHEAPTSNDRNPPTS